MTSDDAILYVSAKNGGDWSGTLTDIKKKVHASEEEVMAMKARIHSHYVTIIDPDYPKVLHDCPQPPFVLYYEGNLDLIKDYRNCFTFVGSRDCTPYGAEMTRKIAEELALRGHAIVSGLARGIDTAAALAAVDHGKAVAIVGNGLGHCYPAENESLQRKIAEQGLLLSEYPDWVKSEPKHFPERNRLLAWLSAATILGGATPHSGTLITAAYALEAGREVGCLPYRADEGSANNLLIQTGAALIENADNVEELISYETKGPREELSKIFPNSYK